MVHEALHLLLAHDDDGSPVLKDGLPGAAAADLEGPEGKPEPAHFWEEGGDPNSLEEQRWGVIAPEGAEGDRLLALIRPLIEARRAAQGGHEVKIYRPPAGLSPAEAARWRRDVFDPNRDTSSDLPRYQLILGDLHQVPLSIQQVQGSDGYVGRLCFRDERGYEAYVEKVLRWEAARAEKAARASLFTVHDRSSATTIGYRALVQPGLEILRRRELDVVELGSRDAPSPAELLEAVKGPDPMILFSVSHGVGAPRGGWRSPQEQRDRQGAISFGREGSIAAADIGQGPFLAGGLWFMFACYGAGTPSVSAYRHWLERLSQVNAYRGATQVVLEGLPSGDQPPFVAALPQAVLANPDGPLAVIGHVDLAWSYGFEDWDTGKAVQRPAKFMEVLRSSLLGDRVGVSFRELIRYMSLADHELAELYDQAERDGQTGDVTRRSHLWMLRQDLAGYILLGDPAVRIPTLRTRRGQGGATTQGGAGVPAPSAGTSAARFTLEGPGAAPDAPLAAGLDIDVVEEAIGHLLTGRGLNEVASEYGIDRVTLRKLWETYKRAGRAALGQR